MRKFWMVKGAGPTSYIHSSKDSALIEAKRLCDMTGREFLILEAMVSVAPTDRYKIEELEQDPIPF